MRTTPRLLPLSLLFGFAACQAAQPAPWSPAPAGETAVHEDWSDVTAPGRIEHDWVDASGTRNRVVFGLVYRTRVAQELLAAECVRSHWTLAAERAQRVCERADLCSDSGVSQCERDLQQQLGEVLFPCEGGAPLATVSAIRWHAHPGL